MERVMDRAAGKIERHALERFILPRTGACRPEVLVGPRNGVDVGIVDLGGDVVMALTSDPFFVMPEIGWERAGWFAVHIVASDACTSGLQPRYVTIDLNLPRHMTDAEIALLWESVSRTCRELGMAVVTGHTGRYDGCAFPIVGGATAVCVGGKDEYVTTAMARPGDVLIVTKGAAIETAGMFGAALPSYISERVGAEIAGAAEALFERMTVVPDARAAVQAGVREAGVTSMHDATEGGIWGGVLEIGQAANVGLVVHREAIIVRPEVRAICDLFGIDPYPASSEGTLLITCRPHRAAAVIDRLGCEGIAASVAGEIVPPDEGVNVVVSGRLEPLEPVADPFWPAFQRAVGGER
jgi:hydrogenase expression/formation protein HypE